MNSKLNSKQVSFECSFVCKTKYNSFMFRIIKSKYLDNVYLKQKLKEYEGNYYIHINKKKINIEVDKQTKYKVYVIFDDFTDGGQYILYYRQVLIKNRGKLPERIFNNEIMESSSDDE